VNVAFFESTKMSLILFENHPTQITFQYPIYDIEEVCGFYLDGFVFEEVEGSVNLALQCKNASAKGNGVDNNNRFPWIVSPSALCERVRGKTWFVKIYKN